MLKGIAELILSKPQLFIALLIGLLGAFSFSDRGKTLILLLLQDAHIEWSDFRINPGYSYLALEVDDGIVLFKINPGLNGSDRTNTLRVGNDAEYVKNLFSGKCAMVQGSCQDLKTKSYTSFFVKSGSYEVFHFNDECEAVIYYKGYRDQYHKHRSFIASFFSENCD